MSNTSTETTTTRRCTKHKSASCKSCFWSRVLTTPAENSTPQNDVTEVQCTPEIHTDAAMFDAFFSADGEVVPESSLTPAQEGTAVQDNVVAREEISAATEGVSERQEGEESPSKRQRIHEEVPARPADLVVADTPDSVLAVVADQEPLSTVSPASVKLADQLPVISTIDHVDNTRQQQFDQVAAAVQLSLSIMQQHFTRDSNQLRDLARDLESEKSRRQQLQAAVDSNSAANTRLIAQNQHLIAEIARLTADNDALKSQVSTSESNQHKAESTNAVLEAQVANMTATHQTDREEIDRLQKEVAQWKGHVDKMRARLDELFKVSMA